MNILIKKCIQNFFNHALKRYLDTGELQYLSLDSTILNNKNCVEINKHLPCNKNRKGLKISTIVDEKGSPLTCNISESTVHDSKLGTKDI